MQRITNICKQVQIGYFVLQSLIMFFGLFNFMELLTSVTIFKTLNLYVGR